MLANPPMRLTRTDIVSLLLLCGTAVGACWWFETMWNDRALFALFISTFLLSGAGLLPSRTKWLHAMSVGLCIGAFLGGCLAMEGFFSRIANPAFQPTPSARLN